MEELCLWIDPEDLDIIPEFIRTKINVKAQLSIQKISKIQNDFALSTLTYENTISVLNKNLQEQNQKYYELEMNFLKAKTNSETVVSSKKQTKISKKFSLLQKQVNGLNQKIFNLINQNKNLNTQIEFIIQNKDIDSQELCQIASSYISQLNELRSNIDSAESTTVKNLKTELTLLRSNEKEYQAHIYEKTREVYDLHNQVNSLVTENELLKQYKQKYNTLYNDHIALSASFNEMHIKNSEFKKVLESQEKNIKILKEVEQIKFLQNETLCRLEKFSKNCNFNEVDIKELSFLNKRQVNNLTIYANELNETKNKLGDFLVLVFKVIEQQTAEIKEKENFIEHCKKSVSEKFTNEKCNNEQSNRLNTANDLLRKENELLKARISTYEIQYDNTPSKIQLSHEKMRNEKMPQKNHTLLNDKLCPENVKTHEDIEELSRNYNTVKNSQSVLKKENQAFKKELAEYKKNTETLLNKIKILTDEISKLENGKYYDSCKREKLNKEEDNSYIKDLENELDLYKRDIRTIEDQFTEYKKLYESTTKTANNENILLMKTNIERKNTLIETLYTLNAKFNEIIDVYTNE